MDTNAPTVSATYESTIEALGVDSALSDLVGQITTLHELIEAVEGRLAPVLVSAPPKLDGSMLAAARERSVIAGRIDDENTRVANANERLRGLLQRLDV